MTALPISDEAVNAAAMSEAMWQGVELSSMVERQQEVFRHKARRAIVTFLEAEGFEVEDDGLVASARRPHFRLVSPWMPAPTTEEGEG